MILSKRKKGKPRPQKVILIAPPSRSFRAPEEHLGIAYLAAEGEEKGHHVEILDCWLDEIGVNGAVKHALSGRYNVVGLSPSMDSEETTIQIVKKLRREGFQGLIILGGYSATFEVKKYFLRTDKGLSMIFRGEADETFPEFLDFLARKEDWTKMQGIAYLQDGKVVVNPPARRIDNLDRLPFPRRDTIEQVIKYRTPTHVCDSRGCYNRCTFCSIGAFYDLTKDKTRWRGRSPENIVQELKELQGMGVTMVKFLGDSFFGGSDWKERAYALCREIKKRNIKIRFRFSTRVNNIDKELFKELKCCGLFAVSLGVESGVQRKLDDYEKHTTIAQNLKAVKILEELGIYVQMGFILFDPWVTLKELEQEYLFLEQTKWCVTKGICSSLFTPDGTKITEKVRKSCGFKSKKGSNYIYKIQNKKASNVYKALEIWSQNSVDLYSMAIDPISAPKIVSPYLLKKFHNIYCQFRNLDMYVFKRLLGFVKQEKEQSHLIRFIEKQIINSSDFYTQKELEIRRLYNLACLPYKAYSNKYI
ncbi:MAG: radical SAM protein [bacterium]|nr:radical SAM protein [bacterium]